nr:C-type mannose receptor 2-like [Hydra vulgaris]
MTCQRYTGNLLSVADSEENVFVVKQLNNDKNRYWIGLNDIQNNGNYEWSDNASLLFFNWKINSPNNQINKDCLEITSEGWINNFCNLSLGFICKVKIVYIDQLTNSLMQGMTDNEVEYATIAVQIFIILDYGVPHANIADSVELYE